MDSRNRDALLRTQRENAELRREIDMESRNAITSNTLAVSGQIAKLQDHADTYTRKIELEKRRIEELDKQIKVMQSKILLQRQNMGGVNAAKENNAQISKQIRILENRLDKALVKFNEALAQNKALRETIDNLRRERVVFDGIYKKLERELHEKKKEMANIIEISNIAYEARDQAQNEMAALKAQADKEQLAFEQEWKELGRLIEQEQEKKMKDLMRVKESKEATRGEMSLEEEAKLRKKVIKGNWGIAKDKASQHVSLEKVQSYEEAFAKIQAATGIADIDELVTTFINAEDQNFSLFNYVNELNNEIEKLEEQIGEIRGEIDRFKGQGVSTDIQRKRILKDLEERLARTEAKAEQYEEKHVQAMRTINNLKTGIQGIFTKIGCSSSAVSEMLGTNGVTESNMMQYLGIIEGRVNELLQLYQAGLGWATRGGCAALRCAVLSPAAGVVDRVRARARGLTRAQVAQDGGSLPADRPSVLLGAASVAVATVREDMRQAPAPAGPPAGSLSPGGASASLAINPPSTGDDYESDEESDEEEEERPMSRDELKQKTLRGLSKRESQNKKNTKTKRRDGQKSRRGPRTDD
eukprot:tig00000113_g5631.t1